MTYLAGNFGILDPKILSGECLSKLPIRGDNVQRSGGAAVTACDSEGEWLTNENHVWLPVLTPVTAHAHPLSLWPFHAHLHYVPCTRDVGDQNQVEVTEAIDCVPNPPLLSARYSEKNKNKKPMDFDHNPQLL